MAYLNTLNFNIPKYHPHYVIQLVEEIVLPIHPASGHHGLLEVIGLYEKQGGKDVLSSLDYW